MAKSFKWSLIFILLLSMSCEKYEEGGACRKAEKNLTSSDWLLIGPFTDNEPIDTLDYPETWNFDNDGIHGASWVFDNVNFTSYKEWSFGDSNKSINFSIGGNTTEMFIIKLTETDLWLDDNTSPLTIHYHMTAI